MRAGAAKRGRRALQPSTHRDLWRLPGTSPPVAERPSAPGTGGVRRTQPVRNPGPDLPPRKTSDARGAPGCRRPAPPSSSARPYPWRAGRPAAWRRGGRGGPGAVGRLGRRRPGGRRQEGARAEGRGGRAADWKSAVRRRPAPGRCRRRRPLSQDTLHARSPRPRVNFVD